MGDIYLLVYISFDHIFHVIFIGKWPFIISKKMGGGRFCTKMGLVVSAGTEAYVIHLTSNII